jgi:hypothetical protein
MQNLEFRYKNLEFDDIKEIALKNATNHKGMIETILKI